MSSTSGSLIQLCLVFLCMVINGLGYIFVLFLFRFGVYICRPGSFVAHIQRSLKLLHDVLLEMQDTTHLLAVAQYLSKKPEQAKYVLA